MSARFVDRARTLTREVVAGAGELEPSIRLAAAAGARLDGPAGVYAEKVRRHAYRVTDEDVRALHAAGWSDSWIFELTEAAAYGAAAERLEAALRAIGEGGGD